MGCGRLAIDLGTGLPRFARNVGGRDFAVGDIHGCFSHLSRSLEAIGFDAAVDRLFSVGDLVDRGPDGLQRPFADDWDEAADDAARLRVVVDQVASLTDASAVAWHTRLVGARG